MTYTQKKLFTVAFFVTRKQVSLERRGDTPGNLRQENLLNLSQIFIAVEFH